MPSKRISFELLQSGRSMGKFVITAHQDKHAKIGRFEERHVCIGPRKQFRQGCGDAHGPGEILQGVQALCGSLCPPAVFVAG